MAYYTSSLSIVQDNPTLTDILLRICLARGMKDVNAVVLEQNKKKKEEEKRNLGATDGGMLIDIVLNKLHQQVCKTHRAWPSKQLKLTGHGYPNN